MERDKLILVINPGSTSTKIALFKNAQCIKQSNLPHSVEEIKNYSTIYDQKDMRRDIVLNWLKEESIPFNDLSCVVGRGGLLRPIPGGTYSITQKMLDDLKIGYQAEHASNLGGIIAFEIANMCNIPAFIVDPVAVDEFNEVARVSGLPEIPRRSLVHALNIKAAARRVCNKLNKDFYNSSFIIAHLGGGMSIAPLENGRIIDVNNANEEGPFSPERSGSLPAHDVVKMAFSGEYTNSKLKKRIVGEGGLTAYLGTNDARIIDKMIDRGDEKAEFILKAMAYQIAKEIGAMAVVLSGKVDAVILTGGLAHNKRLIDWISGRIKFIAPIEIVPGEEEMMALAQGAHRVLCGEETAKIYEDEYKDKETHIFSKP